MGRQGSPERPDDRRKRHEDALVGIIARCPPARGHVAARVAGTQEASATSITAMDSWAETLEPPKNDLTG
jgi:hypothetical protein